MKIQRMIRSMFKQDGRIEKRLFWIVAFIALAIETLSSVSFYFAGGTFYMTTIHLATIGATLVTMIITGLAECYSGGYTVLSLMINIVLIPLCFFYGGGFYSGMPCYIFLGIVMCAVNPSAKPRFISVGIVTVWYMIMFFVAFRYSDMIHPLSAELINFDRIIAVFVSGIAISVVLSVIVSDLRKVYTMNISEYGNRTRMRLELLESQAENIEEAKRQRNEMRRHNMIIADYAEKGDFEGLIKYLGDKQIVDERYSKKTIYCMNTTINSILGIYARQAMNKKVPLEIRTDVSQELAIPEPELVTLVSNILENAIHGAERSASPEKKVVVDIHTKGGKLVIRCKNSSSPEFAGHIEEARQSGIGINIVEKIVRANGGIIDYTIENGMAQCRIVINVGGETGK